MIKEKQPYIKYKSDDTNLEYVVDRLMDGDFSVEIKEFANIGFKNDIYFNKVTVRGNEDIFSIECSDLLHIIFQAKQIVFRYNFGVGNIDNKIKIARFFDKLIKTQSFFVNTQEIKISDEQAEKLNSKIKGYLDFLCKYDDLRKALSIVKEPNFDVAKDSDYHNFEMIYTCIVERKTIDKIPAENGFVIFDLFGIHLLFCVVSSDDKSFIMNWSDENYLKISINENGKEQVLSPYYCLESQETNLFLIADNINVDLIENNVFDDEMTDFKCSCISKIILNLISFFDKTRNRHILDVACNISKRLILINPDNAVIIINDAQIHFRQGNISLEQKKKLEGLVEGCVDNIIRFSCFLLLCDRESLEVVHSSLSPDELEILKGWPIYNLYKPKE